MKKYILFLILITASVTVNAQFYEWVGGSGNWGDPNNWVDEFGDPGVPGYGADVNIGGSDAYVYYDPQFTDLYNSISVYDNATLSATDAIFVFNYFYLAEFSTVELYLTDVNYEYDGSIEVLSGSYDIFGYIKPKFIGSSFVPQIGDEMVVANASGAQNGCGAFGFDQLAVEYDNGNSMFEVTYTVLCASSNQIIIHINDILYTGAISWDGEAGNGLWSTPENWNPNGIPNSDDYVIINKNGGATVNTGGVSQDRISIGKDNMLTITGNIEVSHTLKIIETAGLNWTSGTLQKRVDGDFPHIANWGTLSLNGVSIEDTGTISNQHNGVIGMNGNININNGRIFNINGGTININADNLTIGYTSGSEHKLYNSYNSTIEKTATSGPGTSNIILTEFDNWNGGVIRSEQGILAIGENLNNQGTLTGSGSFTYPDGFINEGVISPGSSPGTLTVVGDLTTAPTATFNIEIDGAISGTEYDQIVVSNEAKLEGTINVTLGYLPNDDASFEIVMAGTLTSCNFPAQITTDFNGTDYTFDVICQNNKLYLNGPGATLSTSVFDELELKSYPNPTNKNVTIDFEQNISEINITIANILGQVITYERFVNTNTINLNIDGSPGIYFVKLTTPEGSDKTIKIIKQ